MAKWNESDDIGVANSFLSDYLEPAKVASSEEVKISTESTAPDWIRDMPIDQLQSYNNVHHVKDMNIRNMVNRELSIRK